jgi:hypothetical protein
MYEELHTVGDPELFQSHLGNSSAARGQFACETEANFMRPGWAQDAVSGEWMVIVNTDVFPQKVRTESCRSVIINNTLTKLHFNELKFTQNLNEH